MKEMCAALVITALAGCSVMRQSQTHAVEDRTSFLGDYSELRPGKDDPSILGYFRSNVDWRKYDSVIVDPVEVWDSPDTAANKDEQTVLAIYYYNALKDDLSKDFTITGQPGPNVMRLRVALANPSPATPVLRTVSMDVPQARAVNAAKNLATGSYAFVGGAQSEAEVLDSMTGKRLAAAVDKRAGGISVKNADVWEWGDAEHAMDYWSQTMDERLVQLRNNGALASQ